MRSRCSTTRTPEAERRDRSGSISCPSGSRSCSSLPMASGDTHQYVGAVDVTMMYSVVDVAGINQISARIIGNAAAAIVGMAKMAAPRGRRERPLIAASMFGVTTPAVTAAREWLEERGYEVLVFHQTGTGGQSMEELVRAGFFKGVLDVTTTELCDELVGGVLPGRTPSASRSRGPRASRRSSRSAHSTWSTSGRKDTVPERFQDAHVLRSQPHRHSDAHDARRMRRARAAARNETERSDRTDGSLSSRSGASRMIATEGQPFHDPAADEALFARCFEQPRTDNVEVHELDLDDQRCRVRARDGRAARTTDARRRADDIRDEVARNGSAPRWRAADRSSAPGRHRLSVPSARKPAGSICSSSTTPAVTGWRAVARSRG